MARGSGRTYTNKHASGGWCVGCATYYLYCICIHATGRLPTYRSPYPTHHRPVNTKYSTLSVRS